MTLAPVVSKAKTKAITAGPKIQPLRIDGMNYYVMFVHPWQAYDLKNASGSVWAQAQREAQIRGDKNGIFTGALGVWDGVILFEHEYVPTAQATKDFATSGTAVPASVTAFRSILCGRQAGVMAKAKNENEWVEEKFDYRNKTGFATGLIGGIQKTTFNSKDYGVIAVDTGATDLS